MNAWIDAHNHLQDLRLGDVGAVIKAMQSVGVMSCVVNATREDDWESVERLALDYPDFVIPAFGVHPWHAHTVTDGWQERLVKLLEKHPKASIGEIGLDQWVESPSPEIQRAVFIDQLQIATEVKRPVTIHCLKAWALLFEALDEVNPPPSFLMHSFGGSIEIAQRLLPLGAYFSFSGYFLHERKMKVLEVFRQLPRERILLETDAPDMLPPEEFIIHALGNQANHPENLVAIAGGLARGLGCEIEALAGITGKNAASCFLNG